MAPDAQALGSKTTYNTASKPRSIPQTHAAAAFKPSAAVRALSLLPVPRPGASQWRSVSRSGARRFPPGERTGPDWLWPFQAAGGCARPSPPWPAGRAGRAAPVWPAEMGNLCFGGGSQQVCTMGRGLVRQPPLGHPGQGLSPQDAQATQPPPPRGLLCYLPAPPPPPPSHTPHQPGVGLPSPAAPYAVQKLGQHLDKAVVLGGREAQVAPGEVGGSDSGPKAESESCALQWEAACGRATAAKAPLITTLETSAGTLLAQCHVTPAPFSGSSGGGDAGAAASTPPPDKLHAARACCGPAPEAPEELAPGVESLQATLQGLPHDVVKCVRGGCAPSMLRTIYAPSMLYFSAVSRGHTHAWKDTYAHDHMWQHGSCAAHGFAYRMGGCGTGRLVASLHGMPAVSS